MNTSKQELCHNFHWKLLVTITLKATLRWVQPRCITYPVSIKRQHSFNNIEQHYIPTTDIFIIYCM